MSYEDKNLNIGSGTIRMGGKPKKEPILRSFDSPEEMAEHAKQQYQIGQVKVNQAELDAGFDIKDIESVKKFDIGYKPLGNTVILKELPKEYIPENDNEIVVYDNSNSNTKYWVIEISDMITNLKRGDLVLLRGAPKGEGINFVARVFHKVRFIEVAYYDIAGVFVETSM